jgi:tricarballylate dehydrogenase
MDPVWDVIVVGAGNAALCAALSAREAGAEVLVLESAPEAERGGNTRFTAGAMRTVYRGADDLQALMPDLGKDDIDLVSIAPRSSSTTSAG